MPARVAEEAAQIAKIYRNLALVSATTGDRRATQAVAMAALRVQAAYTRRPSK